MVAYPGRRDAAHDRAQPIATTGENAYVTGLGLDVVFPGAARAATARTARCRACSSSPTCRTSARGVLASAVGMDKAVDEGGVRGRAACRSRRDRVVLRHEWRPRPRRDRHGLRGRARASRCSSSRRTWVERRHLEGEDARGARRGDRPRVRVRPQVVVEAAVPDGARDRVRACSATTTRRRRCRRDRAVPRVLRLRGQVPRRRLRSRSSRPRSAPSSRTTRSGGWRSRRSARSMARAWRASTSCCRATTGQLVRQRGQHDSRLHHDQHVREDVGGQRPRLSRPARSPDHAGARAPRREAAAAHERGVIAAASRGSCWWPSRRSAAGPPPGNAAHRVRAPRRGLRADPRRRASTMRPPIRRAPAGRRRRRPASCSTWPALWWRIQLDDQSTALDAEFGREGRTRRSRPPSRGPMREPERAEAWFYLGAAYGARVQWRVLRGERLAAARDGKRIKDALEQALALDPTLDDARFGIGLYKYYADIAPAAAKILRFLLLLPGGDRTEGLRRHAARARARRAAPRRGRLPAPLDLPLVRGAAAARARGAAGPACALSTQPALRRSALPRSRTSTSTIASASLAAWQDLLVAAQAGRVHAAPLARARARSVRLRGSTTSTKQTARSISRRR